MSELRGYLRKKSRQGRWQRRFFQTSHQYLCYYKNQNSDDLLACIDLRSVGEVQTVEGNAEDGEGVFYLQLGGRRYYMKAKSAEAATKWVAGLMARRDGDPTTAAAATSQDGGVAPVSPKPVELKEIATPLRTGPSSTDAGRAEEESAAAEVDKGGRSKSCCTIA